MGIIEELIFGGAKEIAEEAATVGAIKGLGKALSGVKIYMIVPMRES